jgi:mono/diheme cytochrome c family protein
MEWSFRLFPVGLEGNQGDRFAADQTSNRGNRLCDPDRAVRVSESAAGFLISDAKLAGVFEYKPRRRNMRILKHSVILVGVAALGASGIAFSAGDVDLGKTEYDMRCAVCHGPAGKGDGPYVNQLKAGSSDITMLAKSNGGEFPTAQVLAVLDGRSEVQAHGPREMPLWGDVYLAEGPNDQLPKDREGYVNEHLRALIAYLETLQEK